MNWEDFVQDIIATLLPITEEELKGLNQTGNVQNYIQCFWDLWLRISSMWQADEFAAFMDGLKPAILQQIAPHVYTLAEDQIMAANVDLHSGQRIVAAWVPAVDLVDKRQKWGKTKRKESCGEYLRV